MSNTKKVKRLLIVTDSLGAPRCVSGEMIKYDDTWVHKISSYLCQFDIETISITINGLDSKQLLTLTNEKLLLYEPDVVVLQLGIVDCAPRVLRDKEIAILSAVGLSKVTRKVISKHHAFLSNLRNIRHTSAEYFKKNLSQVYSLFHSHAIKVVYIPIAPACLGYKLKSPSIENSILHYNMIISNYTDIFFGDIYSESCPEEIFLTDFHHLNSSGHLIVSRYLEKKMPTIFD